MSSSLLWTAKVWPVVFVLLTWAAVPCEGAPPPVIVDGKAFDAAGKARPNVAVTAYLRKGGKQTAITGAKGDYKIPVPPGDVLALEFIDPLYGPVYIDNLAGMTNQHINLIFGVPPQTPRGLIARHAAIERLWQEVQLGTSDEIPRQARTYLKESARKEINDLQNLEITMPAEVKNRLGQKAKYLAGQIDKFNQR